MYKCMFYFFVYFIWFVVIFCIKKNCYKILKVSEGVLENVELGLDDFV